MSTRLQKWFFAAILILVPITLLAASKGRRATSNLQDRTQKISFDFVRGLDSSQSLHKSLFASCISLSKSSLQHPVTLLTPKNALGRSSTFFFRDRILLPALPPTVQIMEKSYRRKDFWENFNPELWVNEGFFRGSHELCGQSKAVRGLFSPSLLVFVVIAQGSTSSCKNFEQKLKELLKYHPRAVAVVLLAGYGTGNSDADAATMAGRVFVDLCFVDVASKLASVVLREAAPLMGFQELSFPNTTGRVTEHFVDGSKMVPPWLVHRWSAFLQYPNAFEFRAHSTSPPTTKAGSTVCRAKHYCLKQNWSYTWVHCSGSGAGQGNSHFEWIKPFRLSSLVVHLDGRWNLSSVGKCEYSEAVFAPAFPPKKVPFRPDDAIDGSHYQPMLQSPWINLAAASGAIPVIVGTPVDVAAAFGNYVSGSLRNRNELNASIGDQQNTPEDRLEFEDILGLPPWLFAETWADAAKQVRNLLHRGDMAVTQRRTSVFAEAEISTLRAQALVAKSFEINL